MELHSAASDIWHNPCPSSVRYCGPIIQHTKNHCFASGRNLIHIRPNKGNPTHTNTANKTSYIKHKMILTRTDGKTYNVIMLSSAQICCILGTKLKEMNHLENTLKIEADFRT